MTRRFERTPRGGRAPALVAGSLALVLGSAAVLGGCAATGSSVGDRLIRDQQYEEAVRILQVEAARQPENAQIARSLGIALLRTGAAADAVEELRRARQIDPRNAQSAYHLARACEEAGDTDCAIEGYGDYLGLGGKGELEARSRLRDLTLEKARRDIEAAIAREADLSAADTPENSIAVTDFANVADSDTLAPLSRGLAAMVITDLRKVEALRVLERERIRVLLDELDLAGVEVRPSGEDPFAAWAAWKPAGTVEGMQQRLRALARPDGGTPYYDGAIDGVAGPAFREAVRSFQADHGLSADGVPGPRTQTKLSEVLEARAESLRRTEFPGRSEFPDETAAVSTASAPRIGRILGARRLVQGAFVPLAGEQIQLDATLVRITDGDLSPAGSPVSGPLREVLRLEKDLVYQILGSLGIAPTDAERREIDRLPTEDFLAFLAWSRGLELEDRGQIDAAAAAYREAASIDPGFDDATIRADVIEVTRGDEEELDKAEMIRGTRVNGSPKERLVRSGSWGGVGPGPDPELDGRGEPSVTPTEIIDSKAILVIEGDLPQKVRP